MPGISRTTVSLKPGKMEEISKFLDEKADEINQFVGALGFEVAVASEDEITVIGLYESSQNARDAADTGSSIFAEIAPFVATSPNREVFSGSWFQLNSIIIEAGNSSDHSPKFQAKFGVS